MSSTMEKTAALLETLPVPGAEPAFIEELRRGGAEALDAGLPTTRSEVFRYTDLRFLFDERGGESQGAPELPALLDGPRLVLSADGRGSARVDLGGGAWASTLGHALENEPALLEKHLGSVADVGQDALAALSAARFAGGVCVFVPKGVKVEAPLLIDFVAAAGDAPLALSRNLVIAEEQAEVVIVEARRGKEVSGSSVATCEVIGAPGARIQHYRLKLAEGAGSGLESAWVRLERDAGYRAFDLLLEGRVQRQELHVQLAGPGSEVELSGLSLGDGEQERDTFLSIDHLVPHCRSTQLFRAVMDDRAQGTFNGKVIVHEGADGSDAEQSNKNLLLSPDAKANTRPQLEIYADEVTASHGATVGQLDPQALFYLRSRGIPEEEARDLLTRAFVAEVVEEIPVDGVRTLVEELVLTTLRGELPS